MHDKETESYILRRLMESPVTKKEVDEERNLPKNKFTIFIKKLEKEGIHVIKTRKGNKKYFRIDYIPANSSIVSQIGETGKYGSSTPTLSTISKNREMGTSIYEKNEDINHGCFLLQNQKIRDWIVEQYVNAGSFSSFLGLPKPNPPESMLLEGVASYIKPHQLKASFKVNLNIADVREKLEKLGFTSLRMKDTERFSGNFGGYSIFIFNDRILFNGMKGVRHVESEDCILTCKQLCRLLSTKSRHIKSNFPYIEVRISVNMFLEEDILKLLNHLMEEYNGTCTSDSHGYRTFYTIPFCANGKVIIKYYKDNNEQIIEAIANKNNGSEYIHADRAVKWLLNTLDYIYHSTIPEISTGEEAKELLKKYLRVSEDGVIVLERLYILYKNHKPTDIALLENLGYNEEELKKILETLINKKLIIVNHNGRIRILAACKNLLINIDHMLKRA